MMKKLAPLMPVISGIMFGSAGVFVRKFYEAGFDGTTIIFARMSIAAALMFLFLWIRDKSLLLVKKKELLMIGVAALLGMMGCNITYNIASRELSLAFAAVLLSIAPVYVLFLSHFLFQEKITGKKIMCVFMTITGCVMVSGVLSNKVAFTPVGVMAGIGAGMCYGLYSILSKVVMEKGVKSYTVTFYSLLTIALVTAPFADYGVMVRYVEEAPGSHSGFLLLHAVCVAMISYVLLTTSMGYIDPGKATILASDEPMAAMVFGCIFFGETPTVVSVLGLLLTVLALGILCKKEQN
ncbi:MAG: DMT family transporter [Lachnospiraceae bacterium]|nr:DMT family transporter [Lachnospiraceae bacterium]